MVRALSSCAQTAEEQRMRGGGCLSSGLSAGPRREESLLKGSTGQEPTSAGLFWGNFLSRGVQDGL